MQKRITLDWDKVNLFKINILKIIFRINRILSYKHTDRLTIKRSPFKGHHAIIWLKKSISDKEHFVLRKKWRDDINRIRLDKQRLRRKEPINILFTEKHDFYYTRK